MKPSFSWARGFRDDFEVGSDSVFGDDYRDNRDCARVRNRASAGEAVSATISRSAATTFSVTIIKSTGITESIGIITESTRTVRAYVTKHQLWKWFRRQFPTR
jgi:acyl-coenzyme A synthetase/AMP-(fatty) acid ligase